MKSKGDFGVMSVWERSVDDYPKPYVVIRSTDGKKLEEFQLLGDALQWAKDNQKG